MSTTELLVDLGNDSLDTKELVNNVAKNTKVKKSNNNFQKKIILGLTIDMYNDLVKLSKKKNTKVATFIRSVLVKELGY